VGNPENLSQHIGERLVFSGGSGFSLRGHWP
jgi:hypothetical protein